MKIEIHNLGPIHHFEFDLDKDIHLIYGKNSVGKSYAIYCIYNLVKNFAYKIEYQYLNLRIHENEKEINKILDDIITKAKTAEQNKVNITADYEKIIKIIFDKFLLAYIQKSLLNTFSTFKNLSNRFCSEKMCISILTKELNVYLSFSEDYNTLNVQSLYLHKKMFVIYKQLKTNRYLLYQDSDLLDTIVERREGDMSDHAKEHLGSIAFVFFRNFIQEVNSLANRIYFLPSSRSGLYQGLNSFSPIIAELSKNRFFIKNKIELPSLSEPISDYFIRLSSLETRNTNEKLSFVASEIEQKILNGIVKYDNKIKRILFNPNGTDLHLDLSEVSSMVAELAPIVTYLKHIIGLDDELFIGRNRIYPFRKDSPKDELKNIIFIEEPEAHLHPEVQVKLMEIFAELPKYGIKVIMTSHSNYMFNKLSNLILANKISADKVASYHMIMTEKGSIDAKDMQATDEGIEDNNFVDVAEQLYNERLELFERLNDQPITTFDNAD